MANINDDIAHAENEQLIESVTKELRREYNKASREMQKKLNDYLAKFNEADERMKERVDAGEVTYKEYQDWRKRQMLIGSRWEQMLDTLTKDAVNVDNIAMSIVKGHMPEAYAIGHNYGTYLIESGIGIDTSYTLYDRFSVERLWRDNPKLLPDPAPESETARRIKENKDYAWNARHIQSAVTQSIIQGEPLREAAKRLQTVTETDYNAAKRNAGTMLTSAHNGGRLDSFKRAEDMGIKCKKTWVATLDGHTRTSHRHIDGETVANDEEFSNGCMFPGDPDGDPREIYNCVTGETNIASNSEIVRSYMHEYHGELITIETSAGVKFTCTPNHPILTMSGWIGAKFLNEGDNLAITFGRNSKIARRYPHINHTFPRIDAIHKFPDVFRRERVSRLSVNFHGDIPTADVEIVTHKRFLKGNGNFGEFKKKGKLGLKNPDTAFMRKSAFMKHLGSICKTALSYISCVSKLFAFFFRCLRHTEIHSLRPVALLYADRVKSLNNNTAGTVEQLGKSLNGFTGIIFADNIISVNRRVSDCHVYNLQTDNNYYFVNNIISQNKKKCNSIFAISHNCRCALVTQIEGFERDMTDPSLRYTAGLQGMSYDDWKAAKGDEPLFKAAQNYTADSKQLEEYTKLLGKKNVPTNVRDFQKMKYTDTNGWEDLKAQARKARSEVKKK